MWVPYQLTGCGSELWDYTYDLAGRPTLIPSCMSGTLEGESFRRDHGFTYDALGRRLSSWIESDESGTEVTRTFNYTYDPDGRLETVLGPDAPTGPDDDYVYDDLGRLQGITHGLMGTSVAYDYDAAGRLTLVEHFVGQQLQSRIVRAYDAADRLLSIEHRDGNDVPLLRIEYTWNPDNTVHLRTEIEYAGGQQTHTTVTSFEYDARKRLIRELRVLDPETGDPQSEGGEPVHVYDLEYAYDQLGNRTRMRDNLKLNVTLFQRRPIPPRQSHADAGQPEGPLDVLCVRHGL